VKSAESDCEECPFRRATQTVVSATYRRSSGRLSLLTRPIFARAFAAGRSVLLLECPYGKHFESTLIFGNVYPNICLLWPLSPS
jgi:hypothetical protein